MSSDVAPITLDPHGAAVTGFIAYAFTAAAVRYAKDGDKAPTMRDRLRLMRIAHTRIEACSVIEKACVAAGIDVEAACHPFLGCLGEVDEYLRPLDWSERVLKTYLGLGLLRDFCISLAASLEGELGQAVRGALAQFSASSGDAELSFDAFAADHLQHLIDSDSQLAARMGLWGRRVVGEEIGILLRVVEQFPELVAVDMGREAIHTTLSEGATSRMRGLMLRV